MKKFKKFLVFVVSVFLLGSCMFISACNQEQNKNILLDKTSVSIIYGQTENNTVEVVATLENFDVGTLDLIYEPSNYFVITSTKVKEQTFSITIKANAKVAIEPTLVEVISGNVSTYFYLEIVLPVENITANSNLYIPFLGKTSNMASGESDITYHNLKNFITFDPVDTKQTDVRFALEEEITGASIVGNNLVINNENFNASTKEINIIATSTNNSILTTTLNIKVIPSIKLIASEIDVSINYNQTSSSPNSEGYKLKIYESGNIETFNAIVEVPSSYNIDVNVNTASGSILDVLSCSKTKTEKGGDKDVYTFVFSAISISSQGAGTLKFDYSYKDEFLKSDENLSATFLCYDSTISSAYDNVDVDNKYDNVDVDNKIVNYVDVSVDLSITGVSPDLNNLMKESETSNAYITYANYGPDTLGEKLSFRIYPEEVIPDRKKITLTLDAGSKLKVIKSDGTELLFKDDVNDDENKKTKSATISANEIIYIKGTEASTTEETLYYCCEFDKTKKGSITFEVKNGITAFGFVESESSTTEPITEPIRTIYGFKGDTEPTCLVYAPGATISGATISDIKCDNVTIEKSSDNNYFKLTFPSSESGTYTITTTNGYSIQAEVILYNKLGSATISLKKDVEFLSGVGDYKVTNIGLENLSIKNGYSVELNYAFNNDSTYEAVKYSFYEPKVKDGNEEREVSVYDTEIIANLKALKNVDGQDFSDTDFSKTYSSFINTSNLNSQKLITAIKSGITIVKIEFFDKKIENGKIMGAADKATETKYLFVQVYDPVKSIESTAKNITLRVGTELSDDKQSLATQTIELKALSNANKQATYNKVFLKGGTISSEVSTYTYSFIDINNESTDILTATLNNSNELKITAHNRVGDEPITLELFATDFVDSANDYSNLKSFVKYVITVTLIKTEQVSDISVTNLNLESESENVKTYEQVYIDLSKNVDSVKQFKLNFEITPAEALEKELNVEFTPTNGTSKDIISVTSNGLITVLGEIGGTGNIEITLKNISVKNENNVKKVLVPIVVADGESYATAFEISSLSEIKDSNKHYVLTIPKTYIYDEKNFIFESFNGGLYGKRYSDEDSSACATINLNGISLFKTLGVDAHIENLNICGTVEQTTSTGNIGFVAETNNGTINNVKVTTYIYNETNNESNNELNGKYVPSVLTAKNENPGGLVGTNLGKISNCSFAGSIDVSALTTETKTANAIAGTNSRTISGCTIIIAKFKINDKTKVVKTTQEVTDENGNKTTLDIYINGVIDTSTSSTTSISFADDNEDDNDGITTKSYSDKTFTGNSVSVKQTENVCYGKNQNGIVFYYQAVDSSKQSSLQQKNTIKLEKLLNISSSSLEIADLKVRALNKDGSICNFVGINADSITLYGVGEFVLEVSSQYDYTTVININLVSMHYFSNFTITHNGKNLTSSSNIQIVVGQTAEIVTKLTHSVKISGVSIELIENTFDVVFDFVTEQTGADGNKLDIKNYITNTKLGVHTINMDTNFVGDNAKVGKVGIYAILTSNYSDFNTLINTYLGLKSTTANFTITKKIGTTAVSANISHGEIEPKDSLAFVATLTTDATGDTVATSDVKILTSQNMNVTNYFDIKTEQITGESKKFNVYVGLKDEYKTNNNYVNKTYTIVVGASNGSNKYDVTTTLTLTVLPQAISNINTTLYKITNKTTNGVAVSDLEPPTSSLLPTQSGMFVVNMFPAYATYDYLEIVSESSTLTTLSFKLQEKDTSENKYKNASSGFEQINGKNGIRIIKDNNNTNGEYYIKIGANADFVDDTIFNLTVNAYYEGTKLAATSSFTLYVKAPEEPEISLNGETRIYRYAQGGSKIENITAVIAGDQINPTFSIVALDNQSTENISYYYERLNNNAEGYAVYNITLSFKDGYNYNSGNDSTQLKLIAKSTKISQGEEIEVSSEMYIYIIDAETEQDEIVVSGALDKNFNVTNFNASEFMLALSENIKASDDFKNAFNALIENNNSLAYYFKNQNTGFTFGDTKENYTAAQTLASYLYFVNGNNYSKVLNEKTDEINSDDDNYNNYVKFFIKGNKLYVQGGALTGSVEMLLKIPYTMPSGEKKQYEYKFKITNNQYTTEDIPKEIADAVGFLNISNEEQAQDYILNEDLFLNDFTTIENTDKIKSLDGNNHTITITSFAEDSTLTDYALFKQISEETTIKNLTINLYYLSTISIQGVTKVNVAGLAIQNDGVVYNCEVMAYYNPGEPNTTSTHGIKIEGSAEANVAGLVLTNNGSITNSRVGGSSKTIVTEVSAIGVVTTQTLNAEIFEIKASGTISGFVEKNTGVISSSFVKNISIQNSYNKQETKITTGFVNENTGTIVMSYAEGGFTDDKAIQSNSGGIEAVGIMSGFVYSNQGTITDCYSNLRLTNSRSQVGRMGAGFVYQNGENGTISRAYSASTIVDNNITQMNFAGITDYGEYNNKGVIDTAYYYISSDLDKVSIESIINTSITSVSDVTNSKTFYGFSFINTEYNSSGTWSISSGRGPTLVNANNIAKSIRYKKKNTTGQNNNVEYLFPYCVGYELGTTTNPIIIRDAEEFNSVFGASKSTDIQNNYSTSSKKIYGSYRIVNNLDMLSLVPKSEQETEYKVNLLSTGYTLTGEQKATSKKGGSLEGNGLTIKNLAISNSSATSNEFGLFKSLENGASISNLNIELANGGVGADHTTFVGTIAGTLKNSSAYNISVKSYSVADNAQNTTKVIGANVTGGVFGRVIGTSTVSNINVENVSVTSTNHITKSLTKITNEYDKTKTNFSDLSIAGGAFGVLDFYQNFNDTQENAAAQDQKSATTINVHVTGGMVVEGMTAGGVVGYVGSQVVARDLSLVVLKDTIAKITAYTCYAGGIAGFSKGYLYQLKAEHESEWQTEIESNMQNYYLVAGGNDSVDRGNEGIFESDVDYKPFAIGGLVGGAYSGQLSIGYSKINVINQNAQNAGGIVGYVYKSNKDSSSSDFTDDPLKLNEIYAIGDVYSNKENAKIGGIIGTAEEHKLTGNTDNDNKNTRGRVIFEKVNALNYWGFKSAEKFNSEEDPTGSAASNRTIGVFFGSGQEYTLTDANAQNNSSTNYAIKEIKFGDASKNDDNISVPISNAGVLTYYDYSGINSDNGAIINLMFKENDWYKDKNWSRDVNEAFPHINYVYPTSSYLIESAADFYKFILHGSEDDAIFIIAGQEGRSSTDAEDYTIDCSYWGTTIGSIRGNIVGLTNLDGFKNLRVPLFSSYYSGTVSGIILKKCSAPLVINSDNCKYRNITLDYCTVSRSYSDSNAGVLTAKAIGSCKFDGITFKNSSLSATATNGGLLFGSHTGTTLEINNITIKSSSSVTLTTDLSTNNTNFGLLFGSCAEANISNVVISKNVSLTASVAKNATASQDTTFKVGLIAGNAINVTIKSLKIDSDVGLKVNENELSGQNNKLTAYIGGLVGYATTLEISGEGYDSNNMPISSYYSYTINVTNMDAFTTMYLGYACGSATTINVSDGFIVFGCTKDTYNNYTFNELTVSTFASTNNYVGGIAGEVNTVTGSDGYIAFYGDLIIDVNNMDTSSITTTYLRIGGAYGTAGKGSSDTDANTTGKICNTVFEGTISFENTKEVFSNLNVGGLVGYVDSGKTLSISNSIASGEINLPKTNVLETTTVKGDTKISGTQYFAGIVGCVDGTLTFADDNVIALTTVFSSKQSDDLDAVVKLGSSGSISSDSKKAKYCSAVTLSVSSQTNYTSNSDFGDLTGTKATGTDTCSCSNCKDTCSCSDCTNNGKTPSSTACSCTKTLTLMEILIQNAPKGSKLNAYDLSGDGLEQKSETGSQNKDKFLYNTTTTNGAETRTYISTKTRKLYINLGDAPINNKEETVDSKVLNYQISLDNAIVFSAGAEIWSTHTPFNTISETSAVSGVVARVYIDETNNEKGENENNKTEQEKLNDVIQEGKNYTNAAGFVNTNKGIVYICSVQETFNSFNKGNTQFQALLKSNSPSDNNNSTYQITLPNSTTTVDAIAGFVHTNSGYIFGSNTNIKIQTNNQSVTCHGFVAQNSGTIEFSYASGVNNGYMKDGNVTSSSNTHTLFAPVAYKTDTSTKDSDYTYGINNCYTIVMAKGIGIDANLPTGVVGESDACEIEIKNGNAETIYNSYDNTGNKTGTKDIGLNKTGKTYFTCNSLYNHNYPTISGGPFAGITYSKRVTMVERKTNASSSTSGTTDEGTTSTDSGTTSGENTDQVLDDTIVFKGLYDNNLYTSASGEKTLADETASTYYFTIPNLTVLKQLSGLMSAGSSGTSQQSTEDTVYHSKFVLINDINVCYTGAAYSTEEGKEINISGNTAHETIIEGLNHGLFNLNLKSELFSSIDGTDAKNPLTLQNIKFGAIVLQGATGIFGKIGTNATLDNIQFVEYTEPKDITFSGVSKDIVVTTLPDENNNTQQTRNVSEGSVTLNAGDKISVATITFTSSDGDGIYGILASTNNGTIKNSNFYIDISANGTQTNNGSGYTLGGFVGSNTNTGTVEICTFSGTVTVIEESLNTTSKVVFGAFIGQNEGTAERLSLKGPNYQTLHVMESGEVLIESVTLDGKHTNSTNPSYVFDRTNYVETYNGNKLRGYCIKEYSTQIFVKTSGEAYVGGIVGINGEFSNSSAQSNKSTPSIEQCYTDYKCEDKEYAVFVGDEYMQMVAYAGGVVGFSNYGTIKNCANISNVAAMSVWQKTTADEKTTTTTGSDENITEEVDAYLYSPNTSTGLVDTGKGKSRVYYSDAVNIENVANAKKANNDLASIYNMFVGEKSNCDLSRIPIYKAFFEKFTTKTFSDENNYFTLAIGETSSDNYIKINNKHDVTSKNGKYSPKGWTNYLHYLSSTKVYDDKGNPTDTEDYSYYLEYPIQAATQNSEQKTGYRFKIEIIDADANSNVSDKVIKFKFTFSMTQGSWTTNDDGTINFSSTESPNNSKFTMTFSDKTCCQIREISFTKCGDWWSGNDRTVYVFDFSDPDNVQEYLVRYFDKTKTYILSADGTLGYYVDGGINVYQERSALAYAGGIAGGMSASTNYTQVADYGNINAGYRAIKPIEQITAKNVGKKVKSLTNDVPWLLIASIYSHPLFKYPAVKAFRDSVTKLSNLLDTPTFYITKYLGTSPRYMTINSDTNGLFTQNAIYNETLTKNPEDLKFINVTLGSSLGYTSSSCQIRMKKFFVDIGTKSPTYYRDGIGWYKKNKNTRGENYYHGFKYANINSTWKYEDATTSKIQCFNYIFGYNADPIVPVIGSGQTTAATAEETSAEIYVDSNVSTYVLMKNTTLDNGATQDVIKFRELSGTNNYYCRCCYNDDEKTCDIFGSILDSKQIIQNVLMLYTTLKENPSKASTSAANCMPNWEKSINEKNSCWTQKNGYYIPEDINDLTLNIDTNTSYNSVELIPNNTIGIVNGEYKVKITDNKQWEKLVNTLNMTIENRTALLQIAVTVELNNNQTEINVENNLFDEFNGTITVCNNSTFKNVILSANNQTNLGFIGTTTGCTLENVTISGVSLNGVSDDSSVGLLIGSVAEQASIVQQQEPAAGEGGVSAQSEPTTTTPSASVTLNNVKINSVKVDFKNTSKTDIIFGGLVGSINSGCVTLNNVELSGSVKLVTGITYAGGLVGKNAGTLNIGDSNAGSSTSSTNSESSTNINLTQLSVASSKNDDNNDVFVVGGVVGYNSGTITVNKNLNIGTQQQIIISADVTASNKSAYAGGFIGANSNSSNTNTEESNNNSDTITIDTNAGGKVTFGSSSNGFKNVGYVLAGFNVLNESNDEFVYPSNAYASTYIAATESSESLTPNKKQNNNITYNSFVSRWIYKNNKTDNSVEYKEDATVNLTQEIKSFIINGITYTISGNNLITQLSNSGLSLEKLTGDKITTTETTTTNDDGEENTTQNSETTQGQTFSIGNTAYTISNNSISATETTYASADGKVKYNNDSNSTININAGDVIYTKKTTLTYYMYTSQTSTTSALVDGTHAYYFAVEKKIEYSKPNNTETSTPETLITSTKTLEYALVLNDVNYEVNKEDRYNLEIYQLSDYTKTEKTYNVTLTVNKQSNDYSIYYSEYKKDTTNFTPSKVYSGMVSDLNNTKILNQLFEDELESSDGDYIELFDTAGNLVLKIISSTVYKDANNNDVYVNSLDEKIYLSSGIMFNIKSVSDDEKIYVGSNIVLTESTTYYDNSNNQITDKNQYASAAKTVTALKNGDDTVATIVTSTGGTTTYYNGSSTSGDNNKLTENNIYYNSDGTEITDESKYSTAAKTVTKLKNGEDTVATILTNTTIYYDTNNNLLIYTKDTSDTTKATIKNGETIVATITTYQYASADGKTALTYTTSENTITLKNGDDTVATITTTTSDNTTTITYKDKDNNELTESKNQDGSTSYVKSDGTIVFKADVKKYLDNDNTTPLVAINNDDLTTVYNILVCIEQTSAGKTTYKDASGNEFKVNGETYKQETSGDTTTLKNGETIVATITQTTTYKDASDNEFKANGETYKLETSGDTTTLKNGNTTVATITQTTNSDGTTTITYNDKDNKKLTESTVTTALSCGGLYATFNDGELNLTQKFVVTKTEFVSGNDTTGDTTTTYTNADYIDGTEYLSEDGTIPTVSFSTITLPTMQSSSVCGSNNLEAKNNYTLNLNCTYSVDSSDGQTTIACFSVDENNNVIYAIDASGNSLTIDTTSTVGSILLKDSSETTKVKLTFDSSSNLFSATDENGTTTYTVTQETNKASKEGTYTSNITLGGEIKLDYSCEFKFKYDGTNETTANNIATNTYTFNDKTYLVVTCMGTNNSFTDYVYLINCSNFYSCGSISYSLSDASSENTASKEFSKWFNGTAIDRYPSFVPKNVDNNILNIQDNLVQPDTNSSVALSITKTWKSAQVDIEANIGDLYYSYTTTYKTNQKTYNINASCTCATCTCDECGCKTGGTCTCDECGCKTGGTCTCTTCTCDECGCKTGGTCTCATCTSTVYITEVIDTDDSSSTTSTIDNTKTDYSVNSNGTIKVTYKDSSSNVVYTTTYVFVGANNVEGTDNTTTYGSLNYKDSSDNEGLIITGTEATKGEGNTYDFTKVSGQDNSSLPDELNNKNAVYCKVITIDSETFTLYIATENGQGGSSSSTTYYVYYNDKLTTLEQFAGFYTISSVGTDNFANITAE